MGGHAFSTHDPPLPTPRMPTEIYLLVLQQTLTTLRTIFANADSPLEAPGKTTYGDIDVIVTSPLDPLYDPARNPNFTSDLAKLLNARAHIGGKGFPVKSFAIPWPTIEDSEGKYIQVDVQYLPTYPQFQWHLFHSAHGDLWNMLGSTIRPFGLTVNDTGMYLRIQEIELLDRNKAKVFLTADPGAILEFLDLDEDKWWKRFESKEDMYEYAASNRFFWVKPAQEINEVNGEDTNGKLIAGTEPEGQEGGATGKKKLKHNDRKRMAQRPIFAEWIDDFIPRCRESGKYTNAKITRDEVRLEAFEKFGIQKEYEDKLSAWTLERHKDDLWRITIKGSIPEEGIDPQLRSACIKTLKKIIVEGENVEGIIAPSSITRQNDGFWDLEAVKEWVEENWKEVGDVGFKLQQQKGFEKMMEKQAKRKLDEKAS